MVMVYIYIYIYHSCFKSILGKEEYPCWFRLIYAGLEDKCTSAFKSQHILVFSSRSVNRVVVGPGLSSFVSEDYYALMCAYVFFRLYRLENL